MPTTKVDKPPRNRSGGRGRRKGPRKADPDARAASSEDLRQLSPSPARVLPTDNQNKSPQDPVSTISPLLSQNEISQTTESLPIDTIPPIMKIILDINVDSDKSAQQHTGPLLGVSDNTASDQFESINMTAPPQPSPQSFPALPDSSKPNPEDPFSSDTSDPWHSTFTELRNMRSRMLSLGQVETVTQGISQQLQAVEQKTSAMETKISHNSQQLQTSIAETSKVKAKADQNYQQLQALKEGSSATLTQADNNSKQIKQMKTEIHALRKIVEDQQQTIRDLNQVKDEFKQDKEDFSKKSRNAVKEMNKLVDAQREQVESFRAIRKDINEKSETQARQSEKQAQQISKLAHDLDHKSLKDQAFRKSHNIAIIGLPEQESRSAYTTAMKFFKNELKIKKTDIDVAYRIGQPPPPTSSYTRPLIVKFSKLSDRNTVWQMRNDVPQPEEQEDGQQRIKIQADLPTQLRKDVNTLYKVAKAASMTEQYKSAHVRDYAIVLDGKEYSARQLETLPLPLRPSVRKTETVLVFFTKFCELSNHYPSIFNVQGKKFYNVEHYLALRRAELSQQQHLIDKASLLQDPAEAKSILNSLRKDHVKEWQADRYEIAKVGIKAKFTQNKCLSSYLSNTEGLHLGEASKDICWGIGMTLEDKHATVVEKWNPQGNLLGRILMQVREELKLNTNVVDPK